MLGFLYLDLFLTPLGWAKARDPEKNGVECAYRSARGPSVGSLKMRKVIKSVDEYEEISYSETKMTSANER